MTPAERSCAYMYMAKEKNIVSLDGLESLNILIIAGVKEVPEEYNNEVMDMMKKHTQNANNESRITQPDLYT